MTTAPPPVLLLGFNRPALLRRLISSLREVSPQRVYVSLDGPRPNHPTDSDRVDECKREVESIDWTTDVRVRFLPTNAGLEFAVPGAVSWALETEDAVLVIEDDVVVGPDLLDFTRRCLDLYRERDDIWHISGYNVVPPDHLTNPLAPLRLSHFPESFAWATWKRAWHHYDPDLTWATHASTDDLRPIVGSTAAALRWKQIFADAAHRRISTWAYRWIGSMWAHGGLCVNPNQNLITYTGYLEGTHTRRTARWNELPLGTPVLDGIEDSISIDLVAERYVLDQVFRGTPAGVTIGAVESIALGALKYGKRFRSR